MKSGRQPAAGPTPPPSRPRPVRQPAPAGRSALTAPLVAILTTPQRHMLRKLGPLAYKLGLSRRVGRRDRKAEAVSAIRLGRLLGWPLARRRPSSVPPSSYAQGSRSPIVWVWLCPRCAGYAPHVGAAAMGLTLGRCHGCGGQQREIHRFPAYISSIEGCSCEQHECRAPVTGELYAGAR